MDTLSHVGAMVGTRQESGSLEDLANHVTAAVALALPYGAHPIFANFPFPDQA